MNDAHFASLSKEHHKGLSKRKVKLLREVGEKIDDFEQVSGPLSISVQFDVFKPKRYFWNGEVFIPEVSRRGKAK